MSLNMESGSHVHSLATTLHWLGGGTSGREVGLERHERAVGELHTFALRSQADSEAWIETEENRLDTDLQLGLPCSSSSRCVPSSLGASPLPRPRVLGLVLLA